VSAHILIAGGGIGGLGAALALAKIGRDFNFKVTVLEQAEVFGEVGAGVQISPNAYKMLSGWGLGDALLQTANFPQALQIRSATSDKLLGQLELGNRAQTRYGFPFATLHRADLHVLLLNALRQEVNVELYLNAKITQIAETNQQLRPQVTVTTELGDTFTADALIGADGLWSSVRQQMLDNSPPNATGHTAWRALLPMVDVPPELQQDIVTAWLDADRHIIAYPVQQGKSLNLVYSCENTANNERKPLQTTHSINSLLSKTLQKVFHLAAEKKAWTRWDLFDRPPLSSSSQLANPAHPRIALLGDAAHPMLPYLAQGAAMALEDAQALAMSLVSAVSKNPNDLSSALQLYAQTRWQRNAKVQARARRNGQIFHAKPPVSWARDAAMGLLGAKLLDIPWLYGNTDPVESTF
jgi:salicylate hydroxylase